MNNKRTLDDDTEHSKQNNLNRKSNVQHSQSSAESSPHNSESERIVNVQFIFDFVFQILIKTTYFI